MISYPEPHDPSDVSNYSIDFAATLDAGETVTSVTSVTVDAAAAALGVRIDSTAPSVSGSQVVYWVSVDAGFQSNAAYVAGIFALFTATIVTSNRPSLQRTAALRIQQSDSDVEAPVPARTFTQADLNAINKAIASGLTMVKYADGSTATYRDLDQMLRVREIIRADVAPAAVSAGSNPRASLATFE